MTCSRPTLPGQVRVASRRAAACLATALLATEKAAAEEFVLAPLWTAGGTGGSTGEYGIPESVAIDSRGQVVATDKGRMMLHVYAREDGRALLDVGGLGAALGKLDRPNGIAVDAAGNILVVEQQNRRVQIFDADYRSIGSFGSSGTALGRFQKPMGIALDAAGQIYVTDEARADVQVFDAAGRPLRVIAESPRLARVESIEIDRAGARILVCDESKSCVNIYDMNGVFQRSFGEQGTEPGKFGNDPNAVRLDRAGRIYINDQGNARINVYHSDTRYLASFRNTGRAMESADGVALSEEHDLFIVADQGNDRLITWDLSEIQCRLSRIENASTAGALTDLAARAAGSDAGTLWSTDAVEFEARAVASGDAQRREKTVLHVRSQADRGGICVVFEETGLATDRFLARVQLDPATDESTGRLAARTEDELVAHVPDGIEIRVPIVAPPALAIDDIRLLDGAARERVLVDAPLFGWRFIDPAGRRTQTAYRLRILAADGAVFWESERQGTQAEHRYDGQPLPRGVPMTLAVAAGAGDSWAPEVARPLYRNALPRTETCAPANGTRLHRWPMDLRARRASDADADPVRAHFELRLPDGTLLHRPANLALDDTVRCSTQGIVLHENDRLVWRLVASDGLEQAVSAWSSIFRNDMEEPPGAVTLLEPEHGGVLQVGPTALSWSPAADPDPESRLRYTIEWSQNESFEVLMTEDAGEATTFEARGPETIGIFYWRVRVTDPTGFEAVSSPRRLRFAHLVRPHGSRDNVTPSTGAGAEAWPAPLRRGMRLQLVAGGAALEIFDVRGRRVRRALAGGDGTWTWDARDDAGRELAPGVYWARVRSTQGTPAPRKVVWLGD